jgi:transcriptional regulator with XRE-family HTH domain
MIVNSKTQRILKGGSMNYGAKIKELRDKAGMTQAELSEKSGISQEHISRIENGKYSPNVKTADKIAGALGVTLMDILKE